jgi:hypothetical protein
MYLTLNEQTKKLNFTLMVRGVFIQLQFIMKVSLVGGVLNNVQTAFGLSKSGPPSSVVGQWVSEDNFMVTLSTFSSGFSTEGILSISNTGFEKQQQSKSALGFD